MARGAKRDAVQTGPVDGPWELPTGWRWERLGALADFVNGAAFKPSDWHDEGVPIIRIQNLTNPNRAPNRTGRVLADKYRVSEGDILVSWSATLDVFTWRGEEAWLNQHIFKVCNIREGIEKRYLLHLLKAEVEALRNSEHLHGSTMLHINRGPFLAHPVPVPEPDTQRRIVARVDELFSEIDDGERALAAVSDGMATYNRSLLKAAVTGQLTSDWRKGNASETGKELLARLVQKQAALKPRSKGAEAAIVSGPRADLPQLPDSWTWALLPQLGDFGRGKSKHRPRNDPRLYGGPYPFIQTGIVAGSGGMIDRYDQTYTDLGLQQSKLWPAGTVCITIAASIAMTGVLAFDACFPDSIVGLACFDGVRPAYVELFIRTVQQELERYAPATAQKNINLETLYQLAVPLPPTAEQDAIIEIAQRESGIDSLFGDELLGAAATLRQSILAAAFRGDLVA